ncbi:hypothetical protein GSI_09143 [Ganoderma sinense ZZ0214-1]|uniref:Uncharacterized protein n=1 Tax=Ganoderma sinense ZZ0214-1 TaxID=1077348 RepID=A0A2G8RN51_9APHY|nr:hypothetical protein GSI_15641 [Ganoderma sinense ZZ0214-1]PIL29095.1 hypothetical protein GSI_09143 [Ganoderma sinense ZZ0214-1]
MSAVGICAYSTSSVVGNKVVGDRPEVYSITLGHSLAIKTPFGYLGVYSRSGDAANGSDCELEARFP